MGIKKTSKRSWLRIGAAVLALILLGGLVFWLTLPDVSWLKKENPQETAMMKFRAEQARQKGAKRAGCGSASPCRASPPTSSRRC